VFEGIINLWDIVFYGMQGYCVQYLFQNTLQPKNRFYKICVIRAERWLACVVWIVIEIAGDAILQFIVNRDGRFLENIVWHDILQLGKRGVCAAVSILFCLCWYQGNHLIKLFLVVQFLALRQLAVWAGYSLTAIGLAWLDLLTKEFLNGTYHSAKYLLLANELSLVTTIFVGIAQSALLWFFVRKIIKNMRCWKLTHVCANKEIIFYLLPALTGLLIDFLLRMIMNTVEDGKLILLYSRYPILYVIMPVIAIVLMDAIVFNFQIYQEMADIQRERAERTILENQIAQMRMSMVETEQLYEGIRSIRHDIKNHLLVLRELLLEKCSTVDKNALENEEVWRYFEEVYQSVDQLDSRVHTGNAVSDAVINAKFRFARKEIKNIQLNAEEFILPESTMMKAYDIGIILNNGLDNAIEACIRLCEKQPEVVPFITVRSFQARDMYFLEIENSFDGVILPGEEGGFPITTKKDKEVHGIGLKNIRNCARKYDGDVDCIVNNRTFTLSVMVRNC
jgi:hypothetical protein